MVKIVLLIFCRTVWLLSNWQYSFLALKHPLSDLPSERVLAAAAPQVLAKVRRIDCFAIIIISSPLCFLPSFSQRYLIEHHLPLSLRSLGGFSQGGLAEGNQFCEKSPKSYLRKKLVRRTLVYQGWVLRNAKQCGNRQYTFLVPRSLGIHDMGYHVTFTTELKLYLGSKDLPKAKLC